MGKVNVVKYSLGEEIVNAISHGIGAIFGIVALVLTMIVSIRNHNMVGLISSIIYGVTMITMYTISCLYHALSPRLTAKKVFRVLDHCDIYLFIAGCYTPFCLSLIRGSTGWLIFSIIWTCAILGVVLNAINLEKYKKISMVLYLVMGWMIIASFSTLSKVLLPMGLYLLLAGGIVYTIGAVFYLFGSKMKYIHSVFHFFVLGGSILQFFSILLYAL